MLKSFFGYYYVKNIFLKSCNLLCRQT